MDDVVVVVPCWVVEVDVLVVMGATDEEEGLEELVEEEELLEDEEDDEEEEKLLDEEDEDELFDDEELLDDEELVFTLDVVILGQSSRLSRVVEVGSSVEAALADAPVTDAVATVVIADETEAAMETVLMATVWFTAAPVGPVTDGDGAFRTAAKSSICGAGEAAPIAARADRRLNVFLMLRTRSIV